MGGTTISEKELLALRAVAYGCVRNMGRLEGSKFIHNFRDDANRQMIDFAETLGIVGDLIDRLEEGEDQPKAGEWTLCSERMPDRGNKKYLVCGNKGGIYIAKFICAAVNGTQIDPWWDAHGRYCPEPVAWMPLPEPYKEE